MRGDATDDVIALRLNTVEASMLEVDARNDGTAEHSFDRSLFNAIELNGSDGNDSLAIDETNGVFTDSELATLIGGQGDDTLTGGSSGEQLDGMEGHDMVLGGPGDDSIDGGPGFDQIDYSSAPSGIMVDLQAETAADGFGGADRLSGIEVVTGTAFADSIRGSDRVVGFTEGFLGGAGDDTIDGGDGFDYVDFESSPAGVHVDLAIGTAEDGHGGLDQLINIEGVGGSKFDDVIVGGNPTGGFESFQGHAGNDTIDGGAGPDYIDHIFSPAAVIVDLGQGYALDGFGGLDRLTNIESIRGSNFADILNGDELANTILGQVGNDTIDGRTGDDALYGDDGDDQFLLRSDNKLIVGGPGIDVADFSSVDHAVHLDLTQPIVNPSDAVVEVENLIGSAFDDLLIGDERSNALDGGAGNDTVRGGGGDDSLVGGGGNDTLDGEEGHDSLSGEEGNDKLAGGPGDDELVGGNGRDQLQGNAGSDNLEGGTGADTLRGNGGSDTLIGGHGADRLLGGGGADRLWADRDDVSKNVGGGAGELFVSDVVYSDDFEAGAAVAWSRSETETTPTGRRFLGQFGDQNVTLGLEGVARHDAVAIAFDLFVIRSWDGNGDLGYGPDIWEMSISGGQQVIHTTFSNTRSGSTQAYPGTYSSAQYPPLTSASERGTLGYYFEGQGPMDAVYHITAIVPHTGRSLQIVFSANGTQLIGDESWGLDNVEVSVGSSR